MRDKLWEEIIDFTKIKKDGVTIAELLLKINHFAPKAQSLSANWRTEGSFFRRLFSGSKINEKTL